LGKLSPFLKNTQKSRQLTQSVVAGVRGLMESDIIHKKDSGHLIVLSVVMALPASIFLWPLFMVGVTTRAMEVAVYIFPVSAFFIFVIYRLYKTSKNRIVLSNKGLLIEDLTSEYIPWSDIFSVNVVEQPVYRGPTAHWLVLKTKYDGKFSSKFVLKMNDYLVGGGVPSCNLTTYKDPVDLVQSNIQGRLKP
jgi:hypothetical protein